MRHQLSDPCPCRALETESRSYAECCAPWHAGRADGSALPQTAEQLMRSRYSAFVLGLVDYLLATWHETTRPGDLELDPQLVWEGLQIQSTRAGGAAASRGVVEFTAHYRQVGQAGSQHERSTFVREHGAWFYLDAL